MQLSKRYPGRTAALLLASLAVVAACSDRGSPVGTPPVDPGTGGPTGPGTGDPLGLLAVECKADVRAKTISCEDPAAPKIGALADAIEYGGQNKYVTLASSNVDYNAATQKFTFNVTVRNLIKQPIGTVDDATLALDPYAVKIFFVTEPSATKGTGPIVVDNADGVAAFSSGAASPYYQYNTVLEQFEISAPKTWQFDMPPSVQEFKFSMAVSAAVPKPRGWIEFNQNDFRLRPPANKSVVATAYNPYGVKDTLNRDVVFTVNDTSLATLAQLNDTTANLTGIRAGDLQIIATQNHPHFGMRVDTTRWTVTGTVRVWKGNVDNDYTQNGNWRPGRRPQPVDTILISPDSLAVPNQYPVLVQNEVIGGIRIDDNGKLILNAFDMTATQNVRASSTFASSDSGILGSSGRLVLTGIAKTVSGRTARTVTTGTYTLDANLTTRLQTRVDAGRLTNPTFRLQVENN